MQFTNWELILLIEGCEALLDKLVYDPEKEKALQALSKRLEKTLARREKQEQK